MASRNRSRPGQTKNDADEERNIWDQLRSEGKRVDNLVTESNRIELAQKDLLAKVNSAHARGDSTAKLEDELSEITREQVKLAEEILAALEGDGGDNSLSIVGGLEVLTALRASSEADSSIMNNPRSTSMTKSSRNAKRKADVSVASLGAGDERDSVAADSPVAGPSPKVQLPNTASRILKGTVSRAGSVPAAREASVKAEENDSNDNLKAFAAMSGSSSNRPTLNPGTEVLYRHRSKPKPGASHPSSSSTSMLDSSQQDGEGILCSITSVIGEGKQRRYEVRDVDPDTESPPFRASVTQLVVIPPASQNESLPELPRASRVLALYPGTTTFYKAEVTKGRVGAGGELGGKGYVKLRFEGEEEQEKEMDVERRYVLPDNAK
ncbi:hypothetical protein K402DRAFT_393945 [Aulographum hederae CBS 113979]|uniref:SGF29 C-terminal domain-containing protein n=1 Tax=Aulographum hederae CBS 113979 TaxID=1176131 RepID=A0A6G1GZS6_9PEZI|nr:hypothetical protein K402DRAFT_393945 [Aulographum hederae CBS 113979]